MGYRGYITSRPFFGERVPQRIQNIVIRDYCEKRDLLYFLSATEVAMAQSYLMLNQLADEIDLLDGIVAYSLFQLPPDDQSRCEILGKVVSAHRSIHFAVETMSVQSQADIAGVDQIFQVKKTLPLCLTKDNWKLSL